MNRKTYTEEFKRESVQLVRESNQTASVIARELGVKETTLYNWVAKYRDKDGSGDSNDAATEQRVRELEKENRRLRMEREILKKATAFFAKDQL